MSQNTSHQYGFTLLEFLVSVGILAIISAVLMQSLYTVLVIRSKQQSIETTAAQSRLVFDDITKSVSNAISITVTANRLDVRGTPCISYRFVSPIMEKATDATLACAPTAFSPLTTPDINVTMFTAVKNANGSVSLVMTGQFQDQFGSHDYQYQTSVIPKVTL